MREKHELPKGVLCEHCGTHCDKEEYKSIVHLEPVVESTTGSRRTINRFNLCNDCYNKYMKFMDNFCGGRKYVS